VREAADRNAELLVLGASRRAGRRGGPVFGKTVDHVLKNAPCRVLVAAGKRTAAA
jgi:nucleotide-binding universal stress UspA family protein